MSFMECTLVVTAGWCSSLASKLAGSPKNEPFRWQKWPIVSESANRNHSPDHRLSRTRHRYASNQLSYLDIVQSRRDATTPAFEREFRATSRKDPALVRTLEELIEILSGDPHNRSGRHKIKKLVGLKPGEGQWRVRWRDYRLRYDILGSEVVLHSFRHRKDAY